MTEKAQKWLDQNYFRVRKELVTIINISDKNLEGSLKLERFSELKELNCSNNKITHLEIKDCLNLKKIICSENNLTKLNLENLGWLVELNCSNNQLTELNFHGCSKLKILDCSNNQLTELDLSNCLNLNLSDFSYSNNFSSLTVNCGQNKELRSELDNIKRVRNILLVGRTGSGKSALANVLLNKNGQFEEVFKESNGGSTSETKEISNKIFKLNGIVYCVIDTPGFGNTELSEIDVLNKIFEARDKFKKEGLSQVFFVTRGKLTEEEVEVYNTLSYVIFGGKVAKYTTIIKTNFPNFRNQQKCEEDKQRLKKENPGIARLIESCNDRLIYVDNPPLDNDYDDEEEETHVNSIEIKKKELTRSKLLTLLKTCHEIYQLKTVEKLDATKLSLSLNDFEELLEVKLNEIKIKIKKVIRKKNLINMVMENQTWKKLEEMGEKFRELQKTFEVVRKNNRPENTIYRQKEELKTKERKNTELRNILVIGRTGSGKSTLANTISGTNKFKESEYSVSETKEIQIEETEIDGVRYSVIDTIGFGDTKLSEEEIWNKTKEVKYALKEEVSQIFFVTKGRFTEEEMSAYKFLKEFVFDKDIAKYTTIVRTHFPGFRNLEKCENEKRKIIEKGEKVAKIIRSCNKVIYIDNPPVDIDEEDEKEMNIKRRNYSKNVLRNHLVTCQEIYKLQILGSSSSPFAEKKNKTQEEEEDDGKLINRSLDEVQKQISLLKNENDYLHQQLEISKRLSLPFQLKKREEELEEVTKNIRNKLGEESGFLLEMLLEIQTDIIKLENDSFTKRLKDLENLLNKKEISSEEVAIICQKQKEITQLGEVIQFLGFHQEQEDDKKLIQIHTGTSEKNTKLEEQRLNSQITRIEYPLHK